LLITGAKRRRRDDSLHPRRLSRVRVIMIAEPVELYELPIHLVPSGSRH
jgi:hypothetical protein